MDRQAAFRRVVRLVPEFRSIVFDRRGYARSRHVPSPYTVDSNVADLRRVVERFGGGRPAVVIGHSFGGVVALTLAARHPELVSALGIYESPMSWVDWWPAGTGGAAAVAHRDDPGGAAEAFLRRFIGDERWARLPERTRESRRAEGRALVDELSDLRAAPPYALEAVGVSVVSAYGSRSAEHVRRAARLIGTTTSGRTVELPDAPHNAPAARPDDFVEMVVKPTVGSAH